jgi:hypothetical protein
MELQCQIAYLFVQKMGSILSTMLSCWIKSVLVKRYAMKTWVK